MKTWMPLALCLALSTLVPAQLGAATHNVQVGPGTTFTPAELNIAAGDTVTWTNAGGLHNVVADDGSFRCADGCDDDGGNGNPSMSAWSFSLTFDDPAFIGYNCEVHVGLGMVGLISVDGVFRDDFEDGTASAWSSTVGLAP